VLTLGGHSATCFFIAATEGRHYGGPHDKSLRIIRNQAKLPYDPDRLPMPRPQLRDDADPSGKSGAKNCSSFISLNPLKSLDSDEIVRDSRNIKDLPGR
jgi:hypothetical protein